MSPAKPTIGRIVNYVLGNGEIRPAIIVRTWPEITAYRDGVNLQVFTDDNVTGSGNDGRSCPMWKTSVQRSDTPEAGKWHWPVTVPQQQDGPAASVVQRLACPQRINGMDALTDERRAGMLDAAKPLIAWLNDHCHPHCGAHVDQTTVVLTEGVGSACTTEFLRD